MLVDDVLDLLSSGGAGTKNTDLFGGAYPTTPATLLGVLETGGFPSVQVMGATPLLGCAMERPRIQVMTRSTEYVVARNRAQQAHAILDGLRTRTINSVTYHWAQAVAPPAFIGRDENNCYLFSLNVDLLRDRSGTS